jgi:hypothetical protein
LSEEEEKRLSHLEKRLVPNVEFDDQALNYLGFGTNIYYMLGHLGWVQFSNGVSAETHKEFALEILMTIAPLKPYIIFCDYLLDHNLSLRMNHQFKEDRKTVPTLKNSSISPRENISGTYLIYRLFARGRATSKHGG